MYVRAKKNANIGFVTGRMYVYVTDNATIKDR
jgi:hypothetical protein